MKLRRKKRKQAMNELKIDKERLVKVCEKCPQVKQFAEELWPEIFAKFKAGDIVEVMEERSGDPENFKGKIGMVVSADGLSRGGAYEKRPSVGVEFQEAFHGHDYGGKTAREGYGWYVWIESLKLLYRKPQLKGE